MRSGRGRGRKAANDLLKRTNSHDMILIDEIHRCGSLGVPQGLFGGLQIVRFPSLSLFPSSTNPFSRRALLPFTPTARKSSRSAFCPAS